MLQQTIALIIIAFFLLRLIKQKKKKEINANEFVLWLSFWIISAGAIIFLKKIDALVALLGFSGSGIDVLLYIGVITLFYFIFKLRLKLEKIENSISELVRKEAIKNKNK
jgi:hypothetical protein